MTEAEVCEEVLRQRSGYVKGLGFDPKPISFSKSKCLSSENEVKLGNKLIEIRLLALQEKSELETYTYPFLNRDGLHTN